MTIRYSPSTGGFYDTDLHGDNIPEDAVYVTPSRHAELMDAQAEGAAIEPSADTGNPVIARIAAPDIAEHKAHLLRAVETEATRRIEAVMPVARQVAALRHHTLDGSPVDDTMRAAFAASDAIHAGADAIRAEIAAADDLGALASFPIRSHEAWPEQ